eukprot:CAMPEP_0169424286 /NCGR_PEP_ID=MMETSP1017-20121227/67953_1 /TAXON_ID=342587 /ORGANISM="Karlodinium micrum, Strain CCMP2283" /LENGTH=70 /DNA_ID=CAMNT_0009534047 /DNA_START=262 /DNA_END=474 /DNA_ORIENTATION=+
MAFQIVIGKAAANKTNKSDELRHKFAWDASRARQTTHAHCLQTVMSLPMTNTSEDLCMLIDSPRGTPLLQ